MKWVFKILRYSGLPFIFRELVQRRRVSILLFHDISPEAAAQAFAYLSRKYNLISLEDFLDACRTKDARRIPAKAMIITFDDGHIRNYQLLPVIRQYHVPLTIFLCSGIVGTRRHFWFLFRHPDFSDQELKRLPNQERLHVLAQAGFTPDQCFEHPQALSRAQVEEMRPYVNFQAHTQFHPCLPQCDETEARLEITSSRADLERDFQLAINAIAYPNGDYTEREIRMAKEAGYSCGLTVDYGFNTIQTDLFRLRRFDANDTGDLNELIVKASGLWGFLKTRLFFFSTKK